MSSLRNKIIVSFSLTNLAILTIAIVVYADLGYLHQQIDQNEKVRVFFDAADTLQQDERKLFLHDRPGDYSRLQEHFERTSMMYSEFQSYFEGVAEEDELDSFEQNLQRYGDLLISLPDLAGDDLLQAQEAVRSTSLTISLTVRDLGQRHHRMLGHKTKQASTTLVIALSIVVVMGVFGALFVTRQVVRPITVLENQLDAVADGDEKKLSLVSQDIEIQSFVQHFNTMLDRLRTQQSELHHHKKAAALGVLVSGVAHELNNPLSNISTSVQLLLEDDEATSPDLRKQWLTHVDSETERARRIVRRLLDSVRHPELRLQPLSAADVVRSAVLLIHRQLDPNILLHIEDITETCINVDRERMQQVFINLILNAVAAGASNVWVFGEATTWEASAPQHIDRVQGEVATISECDSLMLFTIADDGPGIAEDHLDQLFTPFFTTNTGGEGTGLGLYLVEEIIDEHHGCITVENRSEGGTQFLVWLPVTKEECPS